MVSCRYIPDCSDVELRGREKHCDGGECVRVQCGWANQAACSVVPIERRDSLRNKLRLRLAAIVGNELDDSVSASRR